MRRNRIIWLVLWILSLVGISFFGGPVSYGFFTLLTVLPVIAILYLLCVDFCFHIYQELDTNRLVAGQAVPFYFTLKNEFFFDYAGISVKFFSSFSSISGLEDETEYELLPDTGITMETSLVCKYRGEYEVGIKSVIMQDFLRLFKISFHNPETLRVVVKPRLVYLEELKSFEIAATAMRDSVFRDTEPDVLVRKYEPGDDIRQMHWRASARSQQLMIRNRIGEEQQEIAILMGTKRKGLPAEYLPVENMVLETGLALSLYFAGKSIPVQFCSYQGRLTERKVTGMEQFEELYDSLSATEFREEYTDEIFLSELMASRDVFGCNAVFLILQEWTDMADVTVRLLKENHIYAVICLVTDELSDTVCPEQLSGAVFIRIPTDADLKEVL